MDNLSKMAGPNVSVIRRFYAACDIHQPKTILIKLKSPCYLWKRVHIYTYYGFFILVHMQYADPVSDLLDKHGALTGRLFREHCVFHNGNYVKVYKIDSPI